MVDFDGMVTVDIGTDMMDDRRPQLLACFVTYGTASLGYGKAHFFLSRFLIPLSEQSLFP